MPIGTEEDPEDVDEDSASRVSYNRFKKKERVGGKESYYGNCANVKNVVLSSWHTRF